MAEERVAVAGPAKYFIPGVGPGPARPQEDETALAGPTESRVATDYTDLASQRATTEVPEFSGYERTGETPEIEEGRSYITPEATVAGQVSALLDPESDIMQRVTSRSREESAALGMGRSAAATQAGQTALLDKAIQIGSQDAETYAKAALQEQASEYKMQEVQLEAQVAGDLNVQKARINEETNKIQNAFDIAARGLDQESQYQLQEMQNRWDAEITRMQISMQNAMQQADIDANVQMSIMNNAQQAMNDYQITVQQLMGNDAFLNNIAEHNAMYPDNPISQYDIYNDMFATVQSSITFSAQTAGVYDTNFANYINTLTSTNQW